MSAVSTTRRGPYAKTAGRRDEIVAAAMSEFAAHGYHGGSLRQIAKDLGLNGSSVTLLFRSKADLLEAVLDRTDEMGSEFLQERRSGGLASAVLALVERNLAQPELLRLLAVVGAEASAPDHPAHEWFARRYARVIAFFATWCREEQHLGVGVSVDATQFAVQLMAMWDGLQLQWLIDPRRDMVAGMRGYLQQVGATVGP